MKAGRLIAKFAVPVLLTGLVPTLTGGCESGSKDAVNAGVTTAEASDQPPEVKAVEPSEAVPPPAGETDSDSPQIRPAATGNGESQTETAAGKVVALSPEEFKAEFENSRSSRRKAGVVLQVDGVVTGVHTSFGDQPFVTLKTRGDDPDLGTPYYTVDREPWGKLSPGQQVALAGRWDGESGWIFEIKNAGPNPAPVMTAEALAKEFAADRNATENKYRDKTLYVTGKVLEKSGDSAVIVKLQGTDAVPVFCTITGFDEALAAPLEAGRSVTMCGEYFPGLSEEGPTLATCRPVTSFKPASQADRTSKPSRGNDAGSVANRSPMQDGPPTDQPASDKPAAEAETQPQWRRIAGRLEARRSAEGLVESAVAFQGPPGNGRRGAAGIFIPPSKPAGAGISACRFEWEWSDTARGVHVVHPFRTGHLLVLLYRDYAAVFPGGEWPHDGYLGKSSHPVQTTDAFDAVFPIAAKRPVQVVSRIEATGRYTLLIGGREVLTATIDAVEPLRLPESFKGDRLPATWPAGSGGMIIGPVDTGFNRASKIDLLVTRPDGPLVDFRQPVPGAEAQQAALKAVRELLADDYAKAGDAASRRKLARKLHDLAIETRRDPDARFVMLQEASDLAVESLDVERMLAVVETLSRQYAIDESQRTQASLEQMARQVGSAEEGKPIADRALDLAAKAEKRDDFEAALAYATIASIAASRMRDDELLESIRRRRREIDDLQRRFAEAAAAREVLKQRPDDPQANQQLGSYLLFARGNWKEGLPLLAKSGDEQLRILAERELENIRTPEALVALGDAWYELSESHSGREQSDYRHRAAAWYRQAVEKVTGLTRERVRKRLAELDAAK